MPRSGAKADSKADRAAGQCGCRIALQSRNRAILHEPEEAERGAPSVYHFSASRHRVCDRRCRVAGSFDRFVIGGSEDNEKVCSSFDDGARRRVVRSGLVWCGFGTRSTAGGWWRRRRPASGAAAAHDDDGVGRRRRDSGQVHAGRRADAPCRRSSSGRRCRWARRASCC